MSGVRIGLLGNPNTGKSTVFNALTGLHQHTGNWSGKTVGSATGTFFLECEKATLIDLPGVYSLCSDQAEETNAKQMALFGNLDAVVVVVDACALSRHLPLVLQVLCHCPHTVVCLNLMDEAQKQHIDIDIPLLSKFLGVDVIPTTARSKKGLVELRRAILRARCKDIYAQQTYIQQMAPKQYEYMYQSIQHLFPITPFQIEALLDEPFQAFSWFTHLDFWVQQQIALCATQAKQELEIQYTNFKEYQKQRAQYFQDKAITIAETVTTRQTENNIQTAHIDHYVLQKKTGIPLLFLLLCGVFYMTVAGANIPSGWLMTQFTKFGFVIRECLQQFGISQWIESLLMDGIYLTLSWVVSVMLPPMAIFFPLFTILEDFGLLPRIAFLLDGCFRRVGAHGKQALTICMGFGCNAAGVTSCRIIDSPRERYIAILTNSFVPCNGRFPTLIVLSSIFLSSGHWALSGLAVVVVVICAVGTTFLMSFVLSHTLLKGIPSTFVLELPQYRKPQIGRVLVRSLLDRTIFVLCRAMIVAIPAGAVIFFMQNIIINEQSILMHFAQFLDGLGGYMGLSGVILAAFVLGMPANEIVLPILLMVYSQSGMLIEAEHMTQVGDLLRANGWTITTAICAILFSLNHFPCSTTLLTIHKETGSWKWTAIAFLLPTIVGVLLCMLVQCISSMIS